MAGNSARPINEITGVKRPSSVLVRGQSHMEIAKSIGAIPQWWTEAEYVEWAKGPRGYSSFELWQQQPGNENMTLEDYFIWLGFVEASQEAAIIAQIDAAALAASNSAAAAQSSEDDAETAQAAAVAAQVAAEAAQAAAEDAAASIVGGSLAQGAIYGMVLSNNGANPNTHINISVGQCRSAGNENDIIFSDPLIKRLDQVWAEGNTVGGRDVATALALGQSWHVFAIFNPTTLDVDALFSLSPTAPTLPAGYTRFRRIGSLPLLGYDAIPAAGTNIPKFVQYGNLFTLATRTQDYSGQTGNSTPLLRTFALPLGIKVEAKIYLQLVGNGTTIFGRITDPDLGVPNVFGGNDQWGQIRLSTQEQYLVAICDVPCSSAAQVYVHVSSTAGIWAAGVLGWRDVRGQL